MRSFASLLRSPAFLKESWAKNFVESFAFLLYEIAPCHGYARPGGIRTTQMLSNFHLAGPSGPRQEGPDGPVFARRKVIAKKPGGRPP